MLTNQSSMFPFLPHWALPAAPTKLTLRPSWARPFPDIMASSCFSSHSLDTPWSSLLIGLSYFTAAPNTPCCPQLYYLFGTHSSWQFHSETRDFKILTFQWISTSTWTYVWEYLTSLTTTRWPDWVLPSSFSVIKWPHHPQLLKLNS